MTREEKLQKAHQMFDNRNLLTELKWQRNYFNRGYVSKQEELFNLWIFDECIIALEQEPVIDKIRAEIKKSSHGKWYVGRLDGKTEEVLLLDEVLQIIDKYKSESEDK